MITIMKKISALFFLLVFFMFGCASKMPDVTPTTDTNKIPISKISTDYLNAVNVTNSTIEEIDYNKIAQFDSTLPIRDFTYISQNIDSILSVYYNMKPIKNTPLEKGNVIQFNLEIFDKSDNVIHKNTEMKMLFGYGYLGDELEESLLNTIPSKPLTFDFNDKLFQMYGLENAEYVKMNINGIYNYTEMEDTEDFLSQEGYSSFKDFYDYLFKLKVSEHDFEKFSELRSSFLKYAFDCCKFNIPYEDLRDYSRKVIDEHRKAAETLNMTLDDYYSDVLVVDQNSFFLMCAESAEAEIKEGLLIGALAQFNQTEIVEDEFTEFCNKNNVNTSDSVLVCEARYFFLKRAVIEQYVGSY